MADAGVEAEALPKGARVCCGLASGGSAGGGRQRRSSASTLLFPSTRPDAPPRAPHDTRPLLSPLTYTPLTEFETARPLPLTEVRAILAARREKQEEEEGAAAPPPPLQAKALAYAERFDAIRSAVRAEEAASALAARGVLTPAESASLINLMPGTADEARALIPSLGAADDDRGTGVLLGEEVLQEILDELQTYKGLE